MHSEPAYRHQASQLHPTIEKLRAELNISLDEIALVAVTKGPGSYTGIRVGMAAAKMLAAVKKVPTVSLTTLETIAFAHPEKAVTVTINAHGGRVYAQSFDEAGSAINEADAVDADDLQPSEGSELVQGEHVNPVNLAKLAWQRFEAKTDDVNNMNPLYVSRLNYTKVNPQS